MDFNEYNLRQLLELGLRFPEIGAVNFNIIYLILKTIIKKQGLESLTPEFTFVYESPSDAEREIEEESESSDETNEEQEKAKRIDKLEKEMHKLTETVEELENRISELEIQPVHKVITVKKSESEEKTESSEEHSESVSEVDDELETKVSDGERIEELPTETEEESKPPEEKLPQGKFSWHRDRLFKEKLQDIKKEVESLKETDQNQIWTEMQSLQASNDYVVGKFDELLQDFDTVMNGYSKLGMLVEDLDQNVNKKIKIEDDVERLKEQMDKIETYVYTEKYRPEEEESITQESITQETKTLKEEEELKDSQFVRGEVETAQQVKVDRKTHFAKMVKNLIAMPEVKRAEILKAPIAKPEVQKVKPTTMKKAYEKFIKAAQETRDVKEAPEIKLKDKEQADQIDVAHLQEEVEIPASELVQEEEVEPHVRGKTQKKLHRAFQAITLVHDMQKTQQVGRLAKAKEMEALRALRDSQDVEEQQLSVESLEIEDSLSKQLSAEYPKSTPQKATLLFGDEKASQEIKERIVMYIKSRLEETETKFMDKMQMMENSIVELQDENEILKEETRILKSRLTVVEANQNKLEGRLTAVEEKASLNDLHIEEIMIALDKKADRSDAMYGMSRKDMSMLEDRMLQINETTLQDIEELRHFLKEYTVKLRDELDEKVSGFDMDCRLEPLAGRLKKLEKMIKDVSLKARILECQSMGPIEVKRYLHCEDGKRIKPLRRPLSHWTSAAESEISTLFGDDKFSDEENAEKIEAEVQRRLEDAIFRDSKRFIGGAHTKLKVERT